MTIFQCSNFRTSIAAIAMIWGGLATGAQAADLASRPYAKAPVIAPVMAYDWSGFYIGANGGWGSSHYCWNAIAADGTSSADGCHDATGAVAGGQLGYRWQSSAWVFGVEAQGDWANLRGSGLSPIVTLPLTNESRVDRLGLFTGQIGYAVNATLLYVKGGAAVTSNRFATTSTFRPAQFNTNGSDTRWGGVAGVGAEFGFASNWSVGIEYDRLFMQDKTDGLTPDQTGPSLLRLVAHNERISQNVDLVTLRLNYRFGGR